MRTSCGDRHGEETLLRARVSYVKGACLHGVCNTPMPLNPPAGTAPGSPVDPAQRGVALRCLAGACCSGQLLVDLFVNYDCDLEGANLFERLVLALVRTAQAAPSVTDANTAAAVEDAHLRLLVRTAHAASHRKFITA